MSHGVGDGHERARKEAARVMKRFKNRKGQDLVEYGALLVIFVMFAILAINAIRSSTGEIYGNVETGVEGARKVVDRAVEPRAAQQPPAAGATEATPAGGEGTH